MRLEDSWPYVAMLLTLVPLVIFASAQNERGMRRQFVAQTPIAGEPVLLRRYAPGAVAERIESGDANAVGHPQRLRVTALSSDVAGFTALADQIDPESLSQIINEYMAAMSDVVESQGGVVTEFAGDGLMAIFGAPETFEPDEQVRRALSAATAMHARLGDLNKSWFQLGIEQPLQVRIGINTGMLSVGTFGSDGRATYTAIGLQMNVAARIQAQCEPGGILLEQRQLASRERHRRVRVPRRSHRQGRPLPDQHLRSPHMSESRTRMTLVERFIEINGWPVGRKCSRGRNERVRECSL